MGDLCLPLVDGAWIGIFLEVVMLFYAFGGLACAADHLCNAMETLCDHWGIPEDVGGATFMAFGSALPEICVNAISTLEAGAAQKRRTTFLFFKSEKRPRRQRTLENNLGQRPSPHSRSSHQI